MRTIRPKLKFMSPRAAYAAAKRVSAEAPSLDDLFNDSRLRTPLEQLWCAAMFGLGYEKHAGGTCQVAANDTDYRLDADFFALINKREQPFQVVEVLEPGRRRAKEYRDLETGAVRHFHYDPEQGHLEGPTWIAQSVAAKVGVHYAGAEQLHLLVYANFPARDIGYADVVSATAEHRRRFASIWVITDRAIGTLHANTDIGSVNGWGIFQTPGAPSRSLF